MQTEIISASPAAAWLEQESPGSEAKRHPLGGASCCLGRSETTDLPVNSTRVSREHAIIERQSGGWRIRDLKSTNGTFINGTRIEESPLNEGDIIKVADVEFTFHVQEEEPTVTVTQVMGENDHARPGAGELGEWVRALRTLRESLLRGGPPNRYLPIYRLEGHALFGYEATGASDGADDRSQIERQIFATDCVVSERIRQVQRLAAVEETAALGADVRVFLKLAAAEIGARPFVEMLDLLQSRSGSRPLFAQIPVSAVCDTPAFRDFLEELRRRGIGILYDNFAGRAGHAALGRELAPDFVKLATSITRGVEHSSDKQRQIQAVVRACQDAGCEVAVQGVTAASAEVCCGLGCHLAQGDIFQSGTNHESAVNKK
jgi:EAL domain-containing protein (putative c-di-GMP-specific phosphodiesterase class I)